MRVLTTPGKAEQVAAIIRSWKDEEGGPAEG